MLKCQWDGLWRVFLFSVIFWSGVLGYEMDLAMPPYDVKGEDVYLCVAKKLTSESQRITAIEPRSDMEIAHHMLLFGCQEPNAPDGQEDSVWQCHMKQPCKTDENILYGWGKNAPKLTLPEGVGFSVGGDSQINYLVLQVHYLNERPADDKSGVALTMSTDPSPLSASMFAYALNFKIPPGKESHLIPNNCCYNGFEVINTMAFRVHTHVLGRTVYMTRSSGLFPKETVIAERNPQLPQGFVPVEKESHVRPGENLKVTCDFNSTTMTEEVGAGHTHNAEMCNMYMMVYSEIPHFMYCAGNYPLVSQEGPGGMMLTSKWVPENKLSKLWTPPPSLATTGSNVTVGQVAGVARDGNGSIWVLHRGSTVWDDSSFDLTHHYQHGGIPVDVVMQLDADSGKVVRKWGSNLFLMPHMITVDFDNNIWVTDVGRHQALKFTPDGTLLMSLGIENQPGSDETHFCKPTHVAVLNDGSVLVADGYCNSRVVKFDKNGKFLGALNDKSLLVPHSMVTDECGDVLYVADRENSRVRAYKLSEFNLATEIGSADVSKYGRVWALTKGPYGSVLILIWEKNKKAYIIQTARGDGEDDAVWELPEVDWPHDIALGAAPTVITGASNRLFALYVAETRHNNTSEIKKYILKGPDATAKDAVKVPQDWAALKAKLDVHDTGSLTGGSDNAHNGHNDPLNGGMVVAEDNAGGSIQLGGDWAKLKPTLKPDGIEKLIVGVGLEHNDPKRVATDEDVKVAHMDIERDVRLQNAANVGQSDRPVFNAPVVPSTPLFSPFTRFMLVFFPVVSLVVALRYMAKNRKKSWR